MSDLQRLFSAQDEVKRWSAEQNYMTARLELARQRECCMRLLSQHDPVAKLGIDRERLRLVIDYIQHHDLARLNREIEKLIGPMA